MAPTFYTVKASPPCVVVELLARKLNIEIETKNVDMMTGEHKKPEFLKLNLLGKVPALVDDAEAIWDSHAIIAYLASRYAPDSKLFPANPLKQAAINKWLHFDNGTLDAAQRVYYSTLFVDKKAPESKPEKAVNFNNALKTLDGHLADNKFVAGDDLTLADLSILGSLFFADGFDYDFSSFENIKRWRGVAKAELPFYDEVVADALVALKGFVAHMKSQITA